MEKPSALAAFGALSQTTRLDTFRLLVRHGAAGLAAGDIARKLKVPQNTMSAHLAVLARAGLVASTRQSRSIVYRPNLDVLDALTEFLGGIAATAGVILAEPPPRRALADHSQASLEPSARKLVE